LRNEGTFIAWARRSGFKGGLSIEIDGLLAPPGVRVVISDEVAKKRTGADLKKKWWTPDDLLVLLDETPKRRAPKKRGKRTRKKVTP
jgi:hypothetical protein